jgi:hypothetical protein
MWKGRYKTAVSGWGRFSVYSLFVSFFFSHYPYLTLYNQPLKMGPIEGSETSANHYMTPGKYPEEHTQYPEHGESLKSRIWITYLSVFALVCLIRA